MIKNILGLVCIALLSGCSINVSTTQVTEMSESEILCGMGVSTIDGKTMPTVLKQAEETTDKNLSKELKKGYYECLLKRLK